MKYKAMIGATITTLTIPRSHNSTFVHLRIGARGAATAFKISAPDAWANEWGTSYRSLLSFERASTIGRHSFSMMAILNGDGDKRSPPSAR
jgi:hypothetical protein